METEERGCSYNGEWYRDNHTYTKDGMLLSFAKMLPHRNRKRINFWYMGISYTQQTLESLSKNGKCETPLWKIGHWIQKEGRFDFWRMVFENRRFIPMKELIPIWYDCYHDTSNPNNQTVETLEGKEVFNSNIDDPAKLAASVITNPLLIDNAPVRHRYCQIKKPGWEMLRYIDGRRAQKLMLSDPMKNAIKTDNIPAFSMLCDISCRHISFSLLSEIMGNVAIGIFSHLLAEGQITSDVISFPELCCHITAQYSDSQSIPLLTTLEKYKPGLIKNVKDVFGRNLLWYAIHNMRTAWFHPNCKLTPFLLEHGCDPLNENHLGMPWKIITDNLPLAKRKSLLRLRYGGTSYHNIFGPILRTEQPIEKLMEKTA